MSIIIYLICSKRSVFPNAAEIFVVSDSGDILSPKNAPDTIAPAVISNGIPTCLAIIINDTPIVPIEVKDVPVIIATILVTTITIGIKLLKSIILNPQ